MSSLSTHVLDTMHGCPAEGVTVRLRSGTGTDYEGRTNADGRCLNLPNLASGRYALEFEVAGYFRDKGVYLPDPPFLDIVKIEFGIAVDSSHYHVPLLVSPYGYTTYRGS